MTSLYFSQHAAHRHSAIMWPSGSSWRLTRQPKRMLMSVDDSESGDVAPPLGGEIPHSQHV
jgi:hypothetical protein